MAESLRLEPVVKQPFWFRFPTLLLHDFLPFSISTLVLDSFSPIPHPYFATKVSPLHP